MKKQTVEVLRMGQKFIHVRGISLSSANKRVRGLAGVKRIIRLHDGTVVVCLTFQGHTAPQGTRKQNYFKICQRLQVPTMYK